MITSQVNRFWLFSTITLLLLVIMYVPTQAQESGLTETFDDPTLPGWEHAPEVTVAEIRARCASVLEPDSGDAAAEGNEADPLLGKKEEPAASFSQQIANAFTLSDEADNTQQCVGFAEAGDGIRIGVIVIVPG